MRPSLIIQGKVTLELNGDRSGCIIILTDGNGVTYKDLLRSQVRELRDYLTALLEGGT